MQEFFAAIDQFSWTLLAGIFAGLSAAAFIGKFTWGRSETHNTSTEEELKIVLGATLSLFGLLMGFMLSFAISGYNTRVSAEENEALAIGNAFQRIALLQEHQQAPALQLLQNYLQLRTQFFETIDIAQREQIRTQSIGVQTQMWQLISQIAKENPNPSIVTILNACNDLYVTQQKTMASWRQQIPVTAWSILIFFGLCANFLIGYNIRGKRGFHTLIFIIPSVTALTLFMIAEIDVPGKGMIHVQPYNLHAIPQTLVNGGLIAR